MIGALKRGQPAGDLLDLLGGEAVSKKTRSGTLHRPVPINSSAVPQSLARRAATLRRLARRGSDVDALVVAFAEPGGTVLTGDPPDLQALAAHADNVGVVRI